VHIVWVNGVPNCAHLSAGHCGHFEFQAPQRRGPVVGDPTKPPVGRKDERRRKTAKRERPEDGGIVWHEEYNAFECLGCGEFEEIRKRADRTPAKLAELREMLIADHTECWEFDDPRMARDARKYRKEKKRRENLAAQRVSWRGRTV
jgi:hypothetical protein